MQQVGGMMQPVCDFAAHAAHSGQMVVKLKDNADVKVSDVQVKA